MNYTQIDAVRRVLRDVQHERERQHNKWGEQRWPFGGNIDATHVGKTKRHQLELQAKAQVKMADSLGTLTWEDILLEEFCEAAAAETERELELELIQLAGVACAIIEDIRRRRLARHVAASQTLGEAESELKHGGLEWTPEERANLDLDPRCSA